MRRWRGSPHGPAPSPRRPWPPSPRLWSRPGRWKAWRTNPMLERWLARRRRAAGADAADSPAARRRFLRRAQRLVADLPIRVPFDEHGWLADYAAFRGRPIVLRPWP